MDTRNKKSSAAVFGNAASRAKAEQEAIVSRAVGAGQAEEAAPEKKPDTRYAREKKAGTAIVNIRVPQRLHAMMKLHSAGTGESMSQLVCRAVEKELGDDPTALADKVVSETHKLVAEARGGE